MKRLAFLLSLGLSACGITPAQIAGDVTAVAGVTTAIKAGGQEAVPLSSAALLVPPIGPAAAVPLVALGVQTLCTSNDLIQARAVDPTTPVWLGQQVQILKSILSKGAIVDPPSLFPKAPSGAS